MSTTEQYEVATGDWKDISCSGSCARCSKFADLGVDEDWDLPGSMTKTYAIAVCKDCHEEISV